MTSNKNKKQKIETKTRVVVFDRVDYYRDFIINLVNIIYKYYIDDGSFDDTDIDKFYEWCFDKVCDDFKKEGVDFSKNKKLREYFKEYFKNHYFHAKYEIKQTHEFCLKFWNMVFSVEFLTNGDVGASFLDLYSVFDKTINNKISQIDLKNKVKHEN